MSNDNQVVTIIDAPVMPLTAVVGEGVLSHFTRTPIANPCAPATGDWVWGYGGELPPGLSFAQFPGSWPQVYGVVTGSGTYTFTVSGYFVFSNVGNVITGQKTFTITVTE
jgi:hypothetical protein